MSTAIIKTAVIWSTAPLTAEEFRKIKNALALEAPNGVKIPGVRVFLCDTTQQAAELYEVLNKFGEGHKK